MDLTLHRREPRPRRAPWAAVGPLGLLLASCGLAVGFLVAVSGLVERLG